MKKFILGAFAVIALCLISSSSYSQLTTYSVTNSSGMIITGVSISPNDANLWGLSLNTGGNVAVGKSFDFTQSVDSKNCIYDIRYTGEDGKYYYVQDVDLCAAKTIVLPKPTSDMDMKKLEK